MSGKISRRSLLGAALAPLLAPVAWWMGGPPRWDVERELWGVSTGDAQARATAQKIADETERARQDFALAERSRLYQVINARGETFVVPAERLLEVS